MPMVMFDNQKVEYSLDLKAWKRGLTLRVKPDGVVVVAPKSIKHLDVEEFVKKHALWVTRQQEKYQNLLLNNPSKKFIEGEFFSFLGRDYKLSLLRAELGQSKPQCHLEEECLRVSVDPGAGELSKVVRGALLEFYLEQAAVKINESIRRFAPMLDLWPQQVQIADQKSRWGSCSSKGNLRFNWRLVMAPISVLDYVVVHELSHIKHPNHSQRFWSLVESVLADYKARRSWLRENSFRLAALFK